MVRSWAWSWVTKIQILILTQVLDVFFLVPLYLLVAPFLHQEKEGNDSDQVVRLLGDYIYKEPNTVHGTKKYSIHLS